MSNQSGIMASLQGALGAGFEGYPYEGLWHAYWDDQSIASGTFNERMLLWINSYLGESYTNLPSAMQALAEDQGFYNWSSMNEITFEVLSGNGGEVSYFYWLYREDG